MKILKKKNPRRTQVRKTINIRRSEKLRSLANKDAIVSLLILIVFASVTALILSLQVKPQNAAEPGAELKISFPNIMSIAVITALICISIGIYIHHFQKKVLRNHLRTTIIAALFAACLLAAKLSWIILANNYLVITSAIAFSILISLAYNQRFAIGLCIFYCVLLSFISGTNGNFDVLFLSLSGTVAICFSLLEIRTRTKLLEVGSLAALVMFLSSVMIEHLNSGDNVFMPAIIYAVATFLTAMVIGGLLPLIENHCHIVTSLTLLDLTRADKPLLNRLAMEAPGTYTHSLLVGQISQAAADAIGRNGLLCRVGAYYHDIGKINKPRYFTENEMGATSKHKELSPAMSQLVIIGHVKDGIEMAKEYRLPPVLWQFIEAHHGTTLIEYFYNEAKKQGEEKGISTNENDFRYAGPKPRTKEAAIVMVADACEGAVRSLGAEITPSKIEAVVHNMAMKRLGDGQFDACDLTLRDIRRIELSISKTLTAHYHGRIAYPKRPDGPAQEIGEKKNGNNN